MLDLYADMPQYHRVYLVAQQATLNAVKLQWSMDLGKCSLGWRLNAVLWQNISWMAAF